MDDLHPDGRSDVIVLVESGDIVISEGTVDLIVKDDKLRIHPF
jgi:hypothetical protein